MNPFSAWTHPKIYAIVSLGSILLLAGCGGGSPPAETPTAGTGAATVASVATTVAPINTKPAVALRATGTVNLTPPTDLPTARPLPPTWTPQVAETVVSAPTGTFLPPPPAAALKGHLVVLSGEQLTLDGFLPVIVMSPDGLNPQIATVQNNSGVVNLTPSAPNGSSLTVDPDRGEWAVLTPDGQHVIFTYLAGGTDSRLLRSVNRNGSGGRDISSIWGSFPPLANMGMSSLSASGRRLAFAAQNIIGNELYPAIYVVDMTRFNQLAGETDTPIPPTALPTKIPPKVTVVPPTARPPGTIQPTLTLAERYLLRVTPLGIGANSWPAISPDGKTVVFVTDTTLVGSDGSDLYIAPVKADSKPTKLTNDGAELTEAAPDYSPDGKQIAFMVSPKDNRYTDIVLINADGSNRRTLIHADKTNNVRPHWSPDGKYLAFSSDRSGKWEVFIIDVESGATYQVTHNAVVNIVTDWGAG